MKTISKIRDWIYSEKPGWSGDYKRWDDAASRCTNYNDRLILEKVKQALLEVKSGKASFERDSILFYEPDYNWPLLSGLLLAFVEKRSLTIIDFGGSLGSTYFQHRKWLQNLDYQWNVIEQEHFVKAGRDLFEDNNLKFFNTLDEVPVKAPTFLILSSVLAYLPNPYEWLSTFLDRKFDYIFIDRTPLVVGDDRLTIQRVPKEIYDASYPSWFFNKEKFIHALTAGYEIQSEHKGNERTDFPSEFLGYFLTLKK